MKTVMVFGTFDLIHRGHIQVFAEAKKLGDRLVVVIARDLTVERVKGTRPIHTEVERRELVAAIRDVDEARLGNTDDPYQIIKQIAPDSIALGYDQEVFVSKLEETVRSYGLETTIVRLAPYESARIKSKKLKEFYGMSEDTISTV